jgi:hypothetical protein
MTDQKPAHRIPLVSPCGHYRNPTWHRTVIASTFESVEARETIVAYEKDSIETTTQHRTGGANFDASSGSCITV